MTRAEYVALHGVEPHDEVFYGTVYGADGKLLAGGPDISRWNLADHVLVKIQQRYHTSGVDSGGSGQVRKISTGRKVHGNAAADYERSIR